jgi:hypothetical protein
MAQGFSNLDGLVRLSHSEGVDIRRPLVRVLTDLYVQEKTHSREEEQQYVELTLRLLPAVDIATRAAVARKLAVYALTPAPIVEALLHDVPEVAMLMRDALKPVIAASMNIDGPVAAAAAQANASSLQAAPFAPPRDAPQTAEGENPGEHFLRADPAERVTLLDRDDEDDATSTLAERLNLPDRPGTSTRLEHAALQGNRHEFTRELQYALGISGRVASRIVQDETGEPLLVAGAVLEISRNVLLRILLFLNPKIGHSVERVFALYRLYDRMSQEVAVSIVAGWRAEAAARTPSRHQPLLADDPLAAASARDGARAPREAVVEQGRRDTTVDVRQRGQGTS